MDELPIQKIQIAGPTLASLLHRFSSSPGSIHGFLFGHVIVSKSSALSDDPSSSTGAPSSGYPTTAIGDDTPPLLLTATITSFISVPSHLRFPDPPPPATNASVIGWFSGRRRTPLRPSLNDSTTTHNLSSNSTLFYTPQNQDSHFSGRTLTLSPSLFLLLTTPLQDQLIHTHEYKAFQYRISTDCFEPKSLSIINVGPSFRSHYDSFSPNASFPFLPFELRTSCSSSSSSNADMAEDEKSETLGFLKKEKEGQKQLDLFAEGFEIGRLNRLMGTQAANYTSELDDLYHKMLAKLDGLTNLVELSSAKVVEQENHNMKLRLKVAGLE
ncbi:OLC1v1033604C1 [Oldenlandia corymbosa var. corymbosa]|uniref:OLC1v1033604C1 n=1 Tax=Oldenlandia corymbosa var. corymbosa TaxID=529605 RepID=A0AAV1CNM4_OLDCO|nr:OLC1v1033604C1 [Oldenlandia corymbosa var. corymbosa]